MAPSRIVELANAISENTKRYEEYLQSQNIPTPSFDLETPLKIDLPEAEAARRSNIIESIDELQALILGPVQSTNLLRENTSPVLQAIHHFGFAHAFPVGETATFAQIAQKTGRNEIEVRRILRMAMTYHLFQEKEPGVVAHTAATKALAQQPLFNAWIGMWLEEMGPALAHMVEALDKYPGSQEANEAGFNLANNTKSVFYEEIGKFPDRTARFKNAMEYFQGAPSFEPIHAVNGFDWKALPDNATVVDVGGSHGVVCIELARKFPNFTYIVQDRDEVIKAGEKELPSDVAQRIKFQSYDFFDEQPVKGADVYFLRCIFHNWSDLYCVKICKALIPALRKGSRLIIQEILLPEPGEISLFQERNKRWVDFGMTVMANARERDRGDWIELLRQADPRFALKGIITPPGSEFSMIEFVFDE